MSYRNGNGIWVVCDRFNVNRDDFEGSPDRIKANIDLVVEKARKLGMISEGSFDISIRSESYYDEYSYGKVEIEFVFERTETDRERAAREKAEAEVKAEAAAKRKSAAEKRKLKASAEYAEFLRLKEKFKGVA